MKFSDKKSILILAGAIVLGGVILGIMSRVGVPTAGAKANLARVETKQPPQQVMMV